ncbi:probable multidrug resistance-associated protein lethal(2)03659 isoform X1 [Onthophagus taurus]|uniref:probable multidrug resistance-associated protein lethal(2)03659 isoform X1 n=1 Tax=Onthophagus taurus TaxID=166361 RepID=UPI0039BE3672
MEKKMSEMFLLEGCTAKRETNPREKAGVISMLLFLFTYPIFKKGIKKELEEDDIYELLKGYESEKLGSKFENQWKKELKNPKPSLLRVLFGVFGVEYMTCGLIQGVIRTTFMITRPLVIGRLVAYFDTKSNLTKSQAYIYATLLIGITILQTIYNHGYMLYLTQMAQKIRTGLCSLIYRKSLKLSTSSLIEVTNGKIVTLISKDVNLFDFSIILSHDIWVGVIQVALMTYVMYQQIGISAILGVGFLLLLIPFQFWVGKQTTKNRLKTAAKSDERIRLIQEVLSTIRIIKTYCWEIFFSKRVFAIRRGEISKLKIIFYLKATMLTIGDLSTRCSIFVCLISYYLLGNRITAEKAFVILSCYGSLRSVLTVAIPVGISQIADLYSSIKRISAFMLTPEVKDTSENSGPPKIILKNASASVIKSKTVLENITLNLHVGLYGLTGPVGSGKSCLLRLLLDDIVLNDGYVTVNGAVSYASQEPWLFPGTIRQNILFGSIMDEKRYQKVIKICCLKLDFENFSKGDNTLVNDRGLNLSKGQQARINLARALYKKADIYLLDNPLAPVDSSVGNQIFKSFKDFLKGKLVIFCTHQIQFLQQVGEVIVMMDGKIQDRGNYEELVKRNVDLGIDIDEITSNQHKIDKIEENDDLENEDATETDYLLKSEKNLQSPKLYGEKKEIGKVKNEVYKTYLSYAGGFKGMFSLLIICAISQAGGSYFDYFITHWIGVEKDYNRLSEFIKNETYYSNATILSEYEDVTLKKSRIPMLYSIILAVTAIILTGKAFLYFSLTSRASLKLHKATFSNIVKATMSFFDTNLSGNILNRFSKDFATIDEMIPYIFFECLRILFVLIGSLVLILKVNLVFAILSLAFGIILFIVRHYYLPTSRSLKRLDSMTRSPVVGHLNASLEGLTTIRANKAENILTLQFDQHQNLHYSTYYMYMTTNRAFGFFLDMLCALYLTAITLSFIIFASSTAAENVGLAITQALGLTGLLQWGIRQWAELENQMTSVERVLEYTKVPIENTQGIAPKTDWPSSGKIEYKNVCLRYPKTNDLILKGVNFSIKPGEKIGIIGRTGAGKSSIISTLLRLYSIESGSIYIDDIDINVVELNFVRSSISVIPQNPVLFSGTLKSNLDPDVLYSDFDIWQALNVVNVKSTIESLPGQLDCIINEGGSNFSAGEKQLICLARALLRKNKILVLDEATANIDIKTANLIQDTIKTKFSNCTTLTIAHRLHSVMKSDRVMVISDGNVVEFDDPQVLMDDYESRFYQMVSQGNWEMDS